MAAAFAVLVALLATCIIADGSESILINEVGRNSNQSLLWGPYRPNLYFGVRPRIPKSFMGGLMWAKVDDFVSVQHSMSKRPRNPDVLRL
jgi:mannosyl-oligosaccharide glucosidase